MSFLSFYERFFFTKIILIDLEDLQQREVKYLPVVMSYVALHSTVHPKVRLVSCGLIDRIPVPM
jgi:hypothetical protein